MARIYQKIWKYCKNNKIIYRILYPIVNIMRFIIYVYFRQLMFYIGAIFRIVHLPVYYNRYKNIQQLKGRYTGERAFIISTGPSLMASDLEKLKNEVTISMNGIFKLYDSTDWRPDYYIIDDVFLFDDYIKTGIDIADIELSGKKGNAVVVSHPIWRKINKSAINQIIPVSLAYFDHWFTHYSKHFKYSDDLLWGHYDAYTVTNFALNVAAYMGIKELYLLGTDCNFASGISHCGESFIEAASEDGKLIEDAQKAGYRFMKQEMDKRGINVYNATRGGNLEVFPRVNLDELLN